MKELSCPLVLLVLCIIGLLLTLPGCVSMDIPLGESGKYGRVSVGCFPPADFMLLPPDSATIGDK